MRPPPLHEQRPPEQPAPAVLNVAAAANIRLLTFGVVNCDHVLVDMCCGSKYGGRCTWFTDAELKAALARLSQPNVDIVYDARVFKDPEGHLLSYHTSRNHHIISRIIIHKIFKPWLSGIHRKFHEAWGGGGGGGVKKTSSRAVGPNYTKGAWFTRWGKNRTGAG